jgi:Ca2+-binding RTX toxin-like protein
LSNPFGLGCLVLVWTLAFLTIAVSAEESGLCLGKRVTIRGSPGADKLVGTPGPDVIDGRGGSDRIYGRGGSDTICGGDGRDVILGGAGADKISAGAGNDVLRGQAGDDVLLGGPGFDQFQTGSGDDVVMGGPDFDVVQYFNSPAGINLDLRARTASGWGRDSIRSVEQVEGSKFNDVLRGDRHVNALFGGDGHDRLFGRGGTDSLSGGDGSDHLDGGPGRDFASFTLARRSIHANLDRGTASGQGKDALRSIESIAGSQFHDRLKGDNRSNYFIGEAPFDDSGDELIGGGGNDYFLRVDGNSTIIGGSGRDTVIYTYGVTADLGAGTATDSSAESAFTDSLTGIENVSGGKGEPNSIIGSAAINVLRGGNQGDALSGGLGDDILIGGNGNDRLDGGDGIDRLRGGAGMDVCMNGEEVTGCELGMVSLLGPSHVRLPQEPYTANRQGVQGWLRSWRRVLALLGHKGVNWTRSSSHALLFPPE